MGKDEFEQGLIKKDAPFWRKLLHWPIVTGREMSWGALAASSVPHMIKLGLPESFGSLATASSGSFSVLAVVVIAYLSDRCELNIGRRRPFILFASTVIAMFAGLLFLTTLETLPDLFRQISMVISVMVIDGLLCSLDTPLLSYTMDVFNEKDQVQVMTANSFFGGAGGIIGFCLSSYFTTFPIYSLVISALLFSCFGFMNCLSMKEKPLKELRQITDVPEPQSFKKIIYGYVTAPRCLQKLQIAHFFSWNSLIGIWVFYTHIYAVSISEESDITKNYDTLHLNFEGKSFNSTDHLEMNLAKSEIITRQSKHLYALGLQTGSKFMMLYPVTSMSISTLFNAFHVFDKISKRFIYALAFAILTSSLISIIIKPLTPFFICLSLGTGFFTVILYSIPYMMIDLYRTRYNYPKERGLAADCSLMTIAASMGQVIGSVVLTFLTSNWPAEIVVPYYAAISGSLGLLTSLFLVEYKNTEVPSEQKLLKTGPV